jgi:hypothetical protein
VSRILKALRAELEMAGLKPGTLEYQKEERRRRVELCKAQKAVESCWKCDYFDHCELVKAYLRDIHKVEQKDEHSG